MCAYRLVGIQTGWTRGASQRAGSLSVWEGQAPVRRQVGAAGAKGALLTFDVQVSTTGDESRAV